MAQFFDFLLDRLNFEKSLFLCLLITVFGVSFVNVMLLEMDRSIFPLWSVSMSSMFKLSSADTIGGLKGAKGGEDSSWDGIELVNEPLSVQSKPSCCCWANSMSLPSESASNPMIMSRSRRFTQSSYGNTKIVLLLLLNNFIFVFISFKQLN